MNCKQEFHYGAAWYPELWPEADQPREIALMRRAQLNTIRLGEFAWAALEPRPGEFDFAWLDRAIGRLAAAGIGVVLGTPTATPPRWFSVANPDAAVTTKEGICFGHGGRQHICFVHPEFRRRVRILVEALARRYGRHEALVDWQIDNELKGSANDECFCPACVADFHMRLARRYGTIEALNDAWGTGVWSQRYDSFAEIPPPWPTPAGHNPALTTAYSLAQQQAAAEFVGEQAAILRQYSDRPVTTNSNCRHQLDHLEVFRHCDFASFDEYPAPGDYGLMRFNFALWRSFKPDAPFWLMETSPNHGGCIYGGYAAQPPEFLRAVGMALLLAGGGCFAYWLWRRQRSGMEMPHSALLGTWGEPAEGFGQAIELGRELKTLADEIGTAAPEKPPVAILYSDVARTFFRTEPLNGIDYSAAIQRIFRAILAAGYDCDLIHAESELDGYRLILTPYCPWLPEPLRRRLQRWVEGGGRWVNGPLCGHRTGDHTAHTDALLGREFETWAGVHAKYFYGVAPDGASGETAIWGDRRFAIPGMGAFFAVTEAQSPGTVEGGFADGLAWATDCRRGAGRITLFGALPEEGAEALWHAVLADSALPEPLATPGTYAVRFDDGRVFAVNLDGRGGSAGDREVPPWGWIAGPESEALCCSG